ncbi:Uma2 family endonuclease [Streptacidiphilus neutrinimicus]|uniref:Uma2 family endonuclease n=1 Tax=Streptacidiphilus neutrinimicus TaxID=105420 RepID=UPI0005AA2245|nr:Uma2 family endonuclease [Streptacidiphilus neutrinimicus]
MSVDAVTYAKLREVARQLPRIPGAGRVEIAHGGIVMMLPPVHRHELAVLRLSRQLDEQLPDTHPEHVVQAGAPLEDPGLGRLRRPDLMVFREGALEEDPPSVPPADVLLTVEVVSKSNPENAYEEKVRDYAAMGIPLYLLVDPRDGTGIVHAQPRYASRERFVFGDAIKVGPWQLDTSVLLTYGP